MSRIWMVAALVWCLGGTGGAQQIPLKAWNVGGAVEGYPTTFSVWAARGDFPGKLILIRGEEELATQCNVLSRHEDGSVQHALLTAPLDLPAGAVLELTARDGDPSVPRRPEVREDRKIEASVGVQQGADLWTRTLSFDAFALRRGVLPFPEAKRGHLVGGWVTEFESGPLPLVREGNEHSHLRAIFRFRFTAGHGWRTEIVLENCGAPTELGGHWREWVDFTPADVRYDVVAVTTTGTGGWTTISKDDVLFDGTRLIWRDEGPEVYGITRPEYLREHGYLPGMRLDPLSRKQADAKVANHTWAVGPRALGNPLGIPNSRGPINSNMPGAGDRYDIGPVPRWTHWAIRSFGASAHAWRWMLAGEYNGIGNCSWHVRDSADGVMGVASERLDFGMRDRRKHGKLGKPKVDTQHLPNIGYLGWLFTGDRYCEEELCAVASHAIVRYPWQQPIPRYYLPWGRAHAWEQRTTMLAAKLLPDRHPRKSWLLDTVHWNLEQDLQTEPRALGNFGGGNFKGSSRPAWPCATVRAIWNFTWVTASYGWIHMLYDDPKAKQCFDRAAGLYARAWEEHGTTFQGPVGPPLAWHRFQILEYSFPIEVFTPSVDPKRGWREVPGSRRDITSLAETRWWKWVNMSNDIDYDSWVNKRWPPFPAPGPEPQHWRPNLRRIPVSVLGSGTEKDPLAVPSRSWIYYAANWLWPMLGDLGYPQVWADPQMQSILDEF